MPHARAKTEPPATRHPTPVTRHPLPLTRHPPPVTRHPLPLTLHPLPVTRHQSPATRGKVLPPQYRKPPCPPPHAGLVNENEDAGYEGVLQSTPTPSHMII